MKEDVLKGFKIGADDYLSKPFDSEVLLAKIKSILGRRVAPAVVESDEMEFVISTGYKGDGVKDTFVPITLQSSNYEAKI